MPGSLAGPRPVEIPNYCEYRNDRDDELEFHSRPVLRFLIRNATATPGMNISKHPGRKRCSFFHPAWILLLLVGCFAGCGYRVNQATPALAPGKTLEIESFENQTVHYKIDQVFTRAMVQEMVRATNYRVVTRGGNSDAVLKGTILSLRTSPVTFSESSFASTFLVTVSAKVELTENKTGKILYRNQNFTFSEQYVINTDVENFFSEMNPALGRVAEDFSATIVAAILEDF